MPAKVTAIFDIGKTNKKLFLFDEQANVVYKKLAILPETVDEDGFACEDIDLLENWIKQELIKVIIDERYIVEKLNFSTYGASLVHLNKKEERITPLYNYLKPLPESISQYLYQQYKGKSIFCATTASPPMGMLNSGLQLLWLKKEKPTLFEQIDCSLHLPQYLSYLFTGKKCNELTSIGCHTALWNFVKDDFHNWIREEGLDVLFPPIEPYTKTTEIVFKGNKITCGIGLHDSSSALISYLIDKNEPFILLSTGTWNIALNPFNKEPLTVDELNNDCLSYISYRGDPVKASRLFFGNEHDYQIARMNNYFRKEPDYFKTVEFEEALVKKKVTPFYPSTMETVRGHLKVNEQEWILSEFKNFKQAYHQLIFALVELQVKAIKLAKGNTKVTKLYIDGGFAKNVIFITLLKKRLKGFEIIASDTSNASALGAFLLLNRSE